MLVELNGDDAQILPGGMSACTRRVRIALIIKAELACRYTRQVFWAVLTAAISRVFFWLGEVDGNL